MSTKTKTSQKGKQDSGNSQKRSYKLSDAKMKALEEQKNRDSDFVNPYRAGHYRNAIEALSNLGRNKWHSLSDVVVKMKEISQGIQVKGTNIWDKWIADTPGADKDESLIHEKIKTNFGVLQRIKDYGAKLAQVGHCIDIKEEKGELFYKLRSKFDASTDKPVRNVSTKKRGRKPKQETTESDESKTTTSKKKTSKKKKKTSKKTTAKKSGSKKKTTKKKTSKKTTVKSGSSQETSQDNIKDPVSETKEEIANANPSEDKTSVESEESFQDVFGDEKQESSASSDDEWIVINGVRTPIADLSEEERKKYLDVELSEDEAKAEAEFEDAAFKAETQGE